MAEAGTPTYIFETQIAEGLKANPDKAKEANVVYQFNISGDKGGNWTLDLTPDNLGVHVGNSDSAGCTISMSDEDFMAMMAGTLDGQTAFMSGKLQVAGDMSLAMKLEDILKPS